MNKYLIIAFAGMIGCAPEADVHDKADPPALLLSDTLPLKRIAALVPAKSVQSESPDFVLGGRHYGVECVLGEGKRIDSKSLNAVFDRFEQRFEQYNPWIGGEERILVAVDNFGLPILSFQSREGVSDVLTISTVVPSGQGRGWYPGSAFYCELNGEGIVEKLYSIYESGGEYAASDIARPN